MSTAYYNTKMLNIGPKFKIYIDPGSKSPDLKMSDRKSFSSLQFSTHLSLIHLGYLLH